MSGVWMLLLTVSPQTTLSVMYVEVIQYLNFFKCFVVQVENTCSSYVLFLDGLNGVHSIGTSSNALMFFRGLANRPLSGVCVVYLVSLGVAAVVVASIWLAFLLLKQKMSN